MDKQDSIDASLRKMQNIADSLRGGNKLQAIKDFEEAFNCNLRAAKQGVEEMMSSQNYRWEHYEEKYGGKKSPLGIKARLLGFSVSLVIVLIIAVPMLYFMTELFHPQAVFFTVAVELENGEVIVTNIRGVGGVTRQGELLMRYDRSGLSDLIALHLDPYYDVRGSGELFYNANGWIIDDADNPFYDGKITKSSNNNVGSYSTSEKIYDSASNFHFIDTYYNQLGEAVWGYHTNTTPGDLFQTVIESANYGSRTDYDTAKYLNVNKLLEQMYGVEVQLTYDAKDRLVVFKIPSSPEAPPAG